MANQSPTSANAGEKLTTRETGASTRLASSNSGDARRVLREQLRLFAFDGQSPAPVGLLEGARQGLAMRERLAALLEGELNFHGADSGYASHDLHAFAAKFPPQLPRAFIRGLTSPGDIVLDPMMGSGTTVVEALLEGRLGIGMDIDPLALRLGQAKTTTRDEATLRRAGSAAIARATDLLSNGRAVEEALASRFDARSRAFVDYWFLPSTQRELMALALSIELENDSLIRRFLELTLSSAIVTKSGGVSRARDLAHSRPHFVEEKIPKNALYQFSTRLRKNLASISRLGRNGGIAASVAGDARCMPYADGTIDLVVTSPPYANAIDYMRAHKFSLVWLGESISDLSDLRSRYIGSECVGGASYSAFPASVEDITRQLLQQDRGKAGILRKYFVEMKRVLGEMHRVLRDDSAAIVVVGTSIMRGIDVQTHLCLADIAADVGFDVVGVVQRILDRNKRMMPARFTKRSDSMIEQRMHEEYVIGLLKPANPSPEPYRRGVSGLHPN